MWFKLDNGFLELTTLPQSAAYAPMALIGARPVTAGEHRFTFVGADPGVVVDFIEMIRDPQQ